MVGPEGVHALDDGVGLDEEVGVDPLVDLLRHAVRHLDPPVDVQLHYAWKKDVEKVRGLPYMTFAQRGGGGQ